jgi:hypothetical protein
VLYLAGDGPLKPRMVDTSQGRVAARVTEVAPGLGGRGHIYRLEVAGGPHPGSALVALGGVPMRAFARVKSASAPARAAAISSVNTAGLLRRPDRRSELLLLARDEQAQLAGDGWSAVDFDVAGPYRWMMARESRLLLPIGSTDATEIRVQALRRDDSNDPTTMALRLNGTPLPPQLMQPGWRAYAWRIAQGVLHDGTNEMAILVDRPPSGKQIAVSDVRLERGFPNGYSSLRVLIGSTVVAR